VDHRQFHVSGFGSALLGSLVITLIGMLLNAVLPEKAEVH
jgi:putative membrane protein